VDLTTAKSWLLVDFTQDDTLITQLITYCRGLVEDWCKISLIPKTITLTQSNIPLVAGRDYPYGISRWDLAFYGYSTCNKWMELPYGPAISVTSVTNVTDAGVVTPLVLNTDYFVRGTEFKEIKWNNFNDTIIIVFTAGYSVCPGPLKQAILNEVSERYTNRGDQRNIRFGNISDGLCDKAKAAAKQYIRIQI
jgi:hypothetical protein